MSQLAAFRRTPQQQDFARLAEDHIKHDLDESDRDALRSASSTITNWAVIGSLAGVGLGLYSAARLRRARMDMFRVFRTSEKPTQLVFANGRTESLPDLEPLIRPTRGGDFATYFFFGLGGLVIGGETGFLTGGALAKKRLRMEPERYRKIEDAYRRFRADALRAEADRLEKGANSMWRW